MLEASDPIDRLLEALQERAKELNCLYEVDERLGARGGSIAEILRGIVEVIPTGYQFSDVCRARIVFEGSTYAPLDLRPSPWVQVAPIVVQGETLGQVEVFYTEPMPESDEGPFLKEERKLVDTIAERIGHHVMQRRLQAALQDWHLTGRELPSDRKREWHVLLELLSITDRQLLARLSRKMLNHLCWNGIDDAQSLLESISPDARDGEEGGAEDNRPLRRKDLQDPVALAEETFRIAATHLGEKEMASRFQKWIRDDKASFLLQTLENPGSTIAAVSDALQRYRLIAVDEGQLSRPMQTALKVSLVRRFFTDDLEVINSAKDFVSVADFCEMAPRVVGPAGSHGRLGGKSSGLFVASQIVRRSAPTVPTLADIKIPRTWYVTTDGLLDFIQYNHLEDVYNRKYLDLDQVRREYPHIVQVFKNSQFSPEMVKGLSLALDAFESKPLIVRSSSLLEDRTGAAFSGKYKSLFLANQGGKSERLSALMDAIAEVYASIFGPDPLEYRAERGMLDLHEEMGIMIQEVVGTQIGRYFLPAFSGVAFSHNEFRWSPRIKRDDGLARLVPGLGTRAVDRLGDDYPVLLAPGQPGLRANVSPDEVIRYSPKMADVINLETREFESVEIRSLLREFGDSYPMIAEVVSLVDGHGIRRPMGFEIDFERDDPVVTFEGLVTRTPFVTRIRSLLSLLREKLGVPIDIEFACDGKHLYLLQCRSQSHGEASAGATIPADIPPDRIVFSANRYVSNGRIPDITHIVYVDPASYNGLSDLADLREVGRIVGRLNKLLPKHQFILMGPGRWGSRGDIKLGVSVTYSDINNTAMLVEIARKDGQYVPDLSFGTHFFQDLVEASIRYLPLYPDEPGIRFNESFLRGCANILPDLLPEHARLAGTVHVIDVPRCSNGMVLKVLMNADRDEAVAMLGSPSESPAAEAKKIAEPIQETHWRWRLRMVERIAAQVDAEKFGVKAVYVFGSTKNGTAGPASDIDLLVHHDGSEEKRVQLGLWLEGWSLCLCEMNFLRTGCMTGGTLDVHYVTDEDIARQTSYASKIGAVTDAAKPLLVPRRAP